MVKCFEVCGWHFQFGIGISVRDKYIAGIQKWVTNGFLLHIGPLYIAFAWPLRAANNPA